MITIDIDSGSTFTDCFITFKERYLKVKVPTTPYDLAICFFDALKEAAAVCGFNSVKELLRHTSIIRYVTTHGTNTFIMKTGDTVGVLVTKGYEKNLYAEEGSSAFNFISKDMVIGLDEEVNYEGEVVKPLNEEEVLNAIKMLLERGANILVVSFRNSHLNPINERKVKEILNKYYKPHYLGFVPIILASEFCKRPDDMTRTNLAILNAYIHRLMAGFLYRIEDELRNLGYRKPLMTAHVNGGVVSISKTRPIDTVGSSPVAGMFGSLYWSKLYGLKNVVTVEIGGTSFDVGLIIDGSLYTHERAIFGLPVKIPIVEVVSIGLAGSSIIKVEGDHVKIGPESVGSVPGPACYDTGGLDPTVLDADVAAGRINPDYFLGGKIKLNAKRAEEVIERIVAQSLSVSVKESLLKILDKFVEQGVSFIEDRVRLTGKSINDFVAFIYGGMGPAHCLEILEKLGISKAYVFPFSSVFGAFGSSLMGVLHYYEEFKILPLIINGNLSLSINEFNKIVGRMIEAAYRDLEGEGFKREDISLELELEIKEGGRITVIQSPHTILREISDVEDVRRVYEEKIQREAVNAIIEIFRLKARVSLPHFTPSRYSLSPSDSKNALKGKRTVLWLDGEAVTEIYEFEKLKPGSIIEGPAILEGVDTTYVIPKRWVFKVDEYANGLIERI
ncbi:MAG: hydantoinase/oxoprolinase family protein [Candidatus Bathyarchaeia archaeon]